jgi:hypothetical protein
MRVPPVQLRTGVSGRCEARWRLLSGTDELALFGCDYAGAIEWIGGRLCGGEHGLEEGDVVFLPLADADRLVEALYRAFFGDRAELRQPCAECGKPFELSLPIEALTAGSAGAEAETDLRLPGGTVLRGLRVGDLLGSTGTASLVERVLLVRGSDAPAEIEAALEAISPCAMETVETACPACHAQQAFVFDLGRFFLRCCERERPILLREVHLLTRTYGWSLAEILSLDRATRHEFVRLAAACAAARPRAVAA